MDIVSIIIISIGLAMDCFAVSITQGICAKQVKVRPAFRMAFLFGLFQGVMPLIGFGVGQVFAGQIKAYDHWAAFIILALIGGKMFFESIKKEDTNDKKCEVDRFRFSRLITLAIATSIDALATGLIFVSYPEKLVVAVIVIGITSFVLSLTGVLLGQHFGKKFRFNFEMVGGIVLFLIGAKILFQHLLVA